MHRHVRRAATISGAAIAILAGLWLVPVAFDKTPQCKRLERWASANQISDEIYAIRALPYVYRRHMVASLPAKKRSEIWRAHLADTLASRQLTPAQADAVRQAYALLTPEFFDSLREGDDGSEAVETYQAKALEAFGGANSVGRNDYVDIFVNLEGRRRMTFQASRLRVEDAVRKVAHQIVDPTPRAHAQGVEDCNCRFLIDCYFAYCCDPYNSNCSPVRGCGYAGTALCINECKWVGCFP